MEAQKVVIEILKRKDHKSYNCISSHFSINIISYSHISQKDRRELWKTSVSNTSRDTQSWLSRNCVQLVFDSLQEWRHRNLSGQPVPVLGHSPSECLEGTSVFQCVPVAPGPATGHHREGPGSIHLAYLLQLLAYTDKIPLSLPSKERCSSPLIIFVGYCPVALHLSLLKSIIPLSGTLFPLKAQF